jgi:hypothetical protein
MEEEGNAQGVQDEEQKGSLLGKGKQGDDATRDSDLELLISKSSLLFASRNPAVVVAACRLHYYLLPITRHEPLVHALLALVAPGVPTRGDDRDAIYIALNNVLWLLNGGTDFPSPAAFASSALKGKGKADSRGASQLKRQRTYARMMAPYIMSLWPRSDCSASKMASGAISLLSTISGVSAGAGSATPGGAGSSGGAGGAGGGSIGTGINFSSITASISAVAGSTLSGSGTSIVSNTSSRASSTAVDHIFHAKLEILSRLARPENLAWLVEELEDVVKFEWKESRCRHALQVLADITERFGLAELEGGQLAEEGPDRWGLQDRMTELALELLQNVSNTARWSLRRRGAEDDQRRGYEEEDHAMPLRQGIVTGVVKLLASVLKVKDRALRKVREQRELRRKTGTATSATKESESKEKDESQGNAAVRQSDAREDQEWELIAQQEMFEILQRISELLYTSGESIATSASGPAKKLKLIGKRNVVGSEARHALFWMLGEYCRTEVEVDFDREIGEEGSSEVQRKTVVAQKSAAELLCVDVMRKAAGNFMKEVS